MAAESTGRSGGTPPEDAGANGGEYRGGPRMGTTVISGATLTNKSVVHYDVEGVAIVEGDIALGTVEDVEQATAAAREAVVADPNIAFSVDLTGSGEVESGDLISTQSYPALTRGHGNEARIHGQRV